MARGFDASDACRPHPYRFDDDCRSLRSRSGELAGPDRLRYIPLDDDGSAWLTLGADLRFRMEHLDPPEFGTSSVDRRYTARGLRGYALADLRTNAGLRLFTELSVAAERGREPFERSFDRSAIDVAQLFVEVPLDVSSASTTIRIGRQELDLGNTRLVSSRDLANLRLSFDMVHVLARLPQLDIVSFWGRPVLNRPGAFDDASSSSETFYGLDLRVPSNVMGRRLLVDFVLLERNRDAASFFDAVGRERRHMVGVSASAQLEAVDFLGHAAYQSGKVASSRVSAFGLSMSLGYRFRNVEWAPRIGIDAGYASGDRKRNDGRLNSFNPLYPNLGYFTDAPVDYPSNWAGVQPNITLNPTSNVTVRFGTNFHFRASEADAVYGTNGRPYIAGGTPGGHFVDMLTFVHATWSATRRVQVDAGYVHGTAKGVAKANHGRDLDYALLQVAYKL